MNAPSHASTPSPAETSVATSLPEAEQCFADHGYVILPVENQEALQRIQARVVKSACQFLGQPEPADASAFLNRVHQNLPLSQLNGLRLAVISALREDSQAFQSDYYALVTQALEALVGNELAMQRSVGLSVQLPEDDSSLLPIHADVWDGDSPYEVVVWLPLVDCYRSKSMYLVPLPEDRPLQASLKEADLVDAESLYRHVSDKVEFLNVPFGHVLIFSQTLMHGNRVNRETETRWSMNCRFKSLLSPYADKKLMETFRPLSMRPATRLGMRYELPELKTSD